MKDAIEGYFVTTKENLVFDVKGITHPDDRIIAFVRYIPIEFGLNDKPKRKTHSKLYALSDRYKFLEENFPNYLFQDPMGRGLLQAVTKEQITKIHNPTKRLAEIIGSDKRDFLESIIYDFTQYLLDFSSVEQKYLGVSGSILVNLHTKYSDLDLVVYGQQNGLKIYEAMSNLFDKEPKFRRYNRDNLGELWLNRGQTKQIDLASFVIAEKNKRLQGKFEGIDFYIRLVPFPEEVQEPYQKTKIESMNLIEIEATIASDEYSIFSPVIYQLKDAEIIHSTNKLAILPERIFSVRGRYCEIAKKDERVKIKGKLEKVSVEGKSDFYQLVLGTTPNEYFSKK